MRITTTGVQPESYQEHLASLEVAAQGIFGSSFSLEPQTPQEQLFALVALAKAETDLQAVDLATAFSFSNAVGLALDRLGTFVGVLRNDAEESDTAYFIRIEAERASGGSGSTENIESALTALTIVDKALVVQDLTNGTLTPVVAANVNLNASRRNTIAQEIMEKKPPGVELAGALNGAASVGGVDLCDGRIQRGVRGCREGGGNSEARDDRIGSRRPDRQCTGRDQQQGCGYSD